ncbi:aminopeptidase P family N-terminal domain-containing protein, partial [Rhizobium ruizarguesonis]
IATIAADLSKKNLAEVLIADPSSVAWTFNIRGADVPHTPHPLARAIIHADGRAELFLDKRKTGIEPEAYLAQICTQLPPSALEERLAAVSRDGGRVLIDPDIAAYALAEIIRKAGGEVVEGADPAKLPRAVKNYVEINGSAAAHLQDG